MITDAGDFKVSVAWGAGSNRRSPITYKVYHADGVAEIHLDQASVANEWVSLGTYTFEAGSSGYVEMNNEDIDVSGSMFAGGALFEPVAPAGVCNWRFY
jgi:hyaluronate lyase